MHKTKNTENNTVLCREQKLIEMPTQRKALPCALDWLLQTVLNDLTTPSCSCTFSSSSVPFPPTFASPWQNSFVEIHSGTSLLKAKFGTNPPNRLKHDPHLGVRSSCGTNKHPLPNPSFPYKSRRGWPFNIFYMIHRVGRFAGATPPTMPCHLCCMCMLSWMFCLYMRQRGLCLPHAHLLLRQLNIDSKF